jgi:hypothetical protein
MRRLSLILILSTLIFNPLVFGDGEEEVSFADLVAKASDYDGKVVKVSCSVLYAGSEVLAVAEVTEEDGGAGFEGEAVFLRKFKSSLKKKLTKGRYKKRTCYYGPAVLTGEVKTGEFGRKKSYKIQLTIKTVEIASGSASEGFTLLKKNKRTKTDLPPENDVRSARQAVARDGFNPPTYPKYHDGSNLSADTQVLCVTDGKESKVYTIGSMGTCELVNDKIGKLPVAVTW